MRKEGKLLEKIFKIYIILTIIFLSIFFEKEYVLPYFLTLLTFYLFSFITLWGITPGIYCDNPITAVEGNNTANNLNNQEQWYVFVAPRSGKMILSTCGTTTEDTYVEVYLNECKIMADYYNNWGCDVQAKLEIPVFEGYTYYIRWAGIYTSGTYTWNLSITDPIPGEFCTNAIPAVVDTNESDHTHNIDQWFIYKATQDGYANISSCNLTDEDTYVGIYSNCSGSFITENNDYCDKQSKVRFPIRKDNYYYIKWYSYYTTGKYKWTLTIDPPLAGEVCSAAIDAQIGNSNLADHTAGIDQWFKYKATKNGRITANTCGLTTELTYLMVINDCSWGFENVETKNLNCGTQVKKYFEARKDQTFYFLWKNTYTSGT